MHHLSLGDLPADESNGHRSKSRRIAARANSFASAPDLMRLFQNPMCLEIIRCLAVSPQNVSALTAALEVDQSSVSHCLASLLACGAVEVSQMKKQRVYRIGGRVDAQVSGADLLLSMACQSGEHLTIRTQMR